MNNNDLFICYSIPLKKYLESNGLDSCVKGKHCETNNPFWVFFRTKKLNNLLTEWRLSKN